MFDFFRKHIFEIFIFVWWYVCSMERKAKETQHVLTECYWFAAYRPLCGEIGPKNAKINFNPISERGGGSNRPLLPPVVFRVARPQPFWLEPWNFLTIPTHQFYTFWSYFWSIIFHRGVLRHVFSGGSFAFRQSWCTMAALGGTRAITSHWYDICDLCSYVWRGSEYHRRLLRIYQRICPDTSPSPSTLVLPHLL